MSKRLGTKMFSLIVSVLLIASALSSLFAPTKAYAANATYYVDSVGGNDNNNGLSSTTAWKSLNRVNNGPQNTGDSFQPGDHILFKAGGSWNGMLYPKGSGASGNPIVIDKYGTGSKPVINRNEGSTTVNGISFSTGVLLYNQQYWEINNLEVTNSTGNLGVGGWKHGILIFGKDYGTLNHIYVTDSYVHDVNSSISHRADGGGYDKGEGGIHFTIEGTSTPTQFNDIKLEGNTVEDTGMGIGTSSSWMSGTIAYSTNIVIRNNYVTNETNYDNGDNSGVGLIVRAADGAVIEHNTFYKNGVGPYPYRSKNTLIQYNEASYGDYGYDDDSANTNTIMQYNYSHNNRAGFAISMSNGIWRYNISENDATTNGGVQGFIDFTTTAAGTHFYNNVFYMGPNTDDYLGLESGGGPITFENNVFYVLGTFRYEHTEENVFDYNTFYGTHDSGEPSDPHKSTADPKFVNPGNGDANGYKLQASSPLIDAGDMISGNGGEDYFGNTVPYNNGAADRGASEYQGTGTGGDVTAPGISVMVNSQVIQNEMTIPETETVAFTWDATDWGSGVDETTATFDGEAYAEGTAIALAGEAGDHELVVTSADHASNELTRTYVIHVTPSMLDESQNHLNGVLHGDVVEGVNGSAVEGYVTLPDDSSLDITGTQLTVEAWVKPDAIQTSPIITKGNKQYSLKVDGSQLQFFVYKNGWHSVNGTLPNDWVGEWHHVAGVYNGQSLQLYLDGQVIATLAYSGSINSDDYAVNIGRDAERNQASNGAIDQARIYNRALTVTELNDTSRQPDANTVLWMDFDETMVDESQNQLNGVLHGDVVEGVNGSAIEGYVTLPDEPSLDITGTPLTLEAWVKPDAIQTSPIITKGNHQYSLKVDGSQLQFFVYKNGWHSVNGTLPNDWVGEWHHVAGIYNGQSLQLYLDGQIIATLAYTGSINSDDYAVNIGRDAERNQASNGAIDQVRIYDSALTVTELNDTNRQPDADTLLWMDF